MKKLLQFTSLCICTLLLCFCMAPQTARASSSQTQNISIELQYGQTEAREMLQMINAFRTNPSEAWAWSENNSTKVQYSNLSPLQYDYGLEKIAMLRAAEIALSYSHTRPNGTVCFTAFENIAFTSLGENIAAGYRTGASVFEGWQETDEPYDGQGHRRNMLDDSFNAIGIGHVYYNGTHYWVQEFAAVRSVNTAAVAVNDSEETVALEVLASNISDISLTCSTEELTMTEGEQTQLPQVSLTARIADHYPRSSACPIIPQGDTSIRSAEWTSSDPGTVSVSSDGTIQALAEGKTTLQASWNDLTASCEVTVLPSSGGSDTPDRGDEYGSGNSDFGSTGFTIPSAKLTGAKNSGKGKLKVTWKKDTSADGYTIMYSTSKNFSSYKTKNAGSLTNTKTISGLKKGRTYYVRIRAYKKAGGYTYYGSWSSVKKVKIKK